MCMESVWIFFPLTHKEKCNNIFCILCAIFLAGVFIFVSIKMLDGGGLKENKRDEDEYQEDGLENATHASVSTLRWNYSILPENSTEAFSDMFPLQTL